MQIVVPLLLITFPLLLLTSCSEEENNQTEQTTDFAEQQIPDHVSFNFHVKPILSDRCYACHGPDKAKIEAGLSLSDPKSAYAALGDKKDHFGIVPGKPAESTLVERIYTDDETIMMPPPESNLTLNDYERAILKKWVEQGAGYEKHWSFQPISSPIIPETRWPEAVENDIDPFILKGIDEAGSTPLGPAEKELLIRRLAFDLTGLPPTLVEIDAYLADSSEFAYENLVDHYLGQPAYAENMTRHWLDVARYADTHGYQDDLERTMWPWRDWVIHAFQQNLSYDEFVRLQLAGDLLPEASREQIIATGFNRNHKITQEGGVIPEEYRVEYVSDRTLTFGKAFLGLSVECAKCHDHKYDPVSQKDYYSLFAFFNNVPEQGLIEAYGQTPDPFITLTKEEIEEKLTFIQNLDTLEKIELMVMDEQPEPRKTFVLGRGVYDNPQEEVFPNAPEAILPFEGFEKNRKGLADWLFDPRHPLTSRVMVNRLWAMCFGRGLVATADDFGAQGNLPTHPELLDHLAHKFIADGWDMKKMIRYIVTSATYRRSSVITPKRLEQDPENRLYARGNRVRLSAEQVRDHVLASSGLLVNTIGGPSAKPYQPEGLWAEVVGGGGGSTARYVKDEGDKQYRRGLYTFWKRTVPPPDMITFDAVTRDFCMVDRERTSTPLQALVMMNNPQIIEGSRSLAHRAVTSTATPSELSSGRAGLKSVIRYMYRSATSREPGEVQIDLLTKYFTAELDRFNKAPQEAEAFLGIGDFDKRPDLPEAEFAAYSMLATAIYNLDESISRS